MKNFTIVLIISLFIFNSVPAQTTWKVLSAPRTSDNFIASSFINDNEGWIVDDSSILWHTADGCESMDTVSSGKHFTKLDFVNAQVGYALDATSVYKTTDGGLTWTTLGIPAAYLSTIYFLNEDTGFVSGYGEYYKTTNAGATWSTISMPYSMIWTDFFFTDDSTGFATTADYYYEHEIYKTTDCGLTWTGINQEPESHLYCIWFANKDSGWAGGYYDSGQEYSQIFATIDGGNTWSEVFEGDGIGDYPFTDLRFKSNHIQGYAITKYDDAVATDGIGYWNTNWGFVYDTDTLGLPKGAINFTRAIDGFDDLYLFGKYGTTLKWEKDTAQWKEMSGRLVSDVNDLSFSSASNGWMTTGGTGILRTTDGGATWQTTAGPRFYVNNVDAVNDSLVFAAADWDFWNDAPIYRSTDGGLTWDSIASFPSLRLSEMQMIDANNGYIISNGNGNPATIYKTSDGGITWTPNSVGTGWDSQDTWSMFFINASEGWAVRGGPDGAYQTIYRTLDGALTWSLIYQVPTSYLLVNVFFLNSQHGYLTTTGSNYYETLDGGVSWSAKSIPGASNYRTAFFSDSLTGWLLTKYDIYSTIDGGTTWSNDYHSTTELFSLEHAEDAEVFVRGFYGFLVKGNNVAPCEASFTLTADTATQGLYYGYNLSSGTDLSYSWDWGDGSTSTGQFPTHTYADSGWYNICLSVYDNYNGCTDTFCLNFYIMKTDGEMGIHQIIFVNGAVPTQSTPDESMEINISPNPFSGSTSIELSLSKPADVTIELLDLQGRKIRTMASQNFSEGKNEITLNRESLGAGIYFLQFKTSSETVTEKLVLE